MSDTNPDANKAKVSPAFQNRLNSLDADRPVKTIVLLQPEGAHSASGKRQSRAERQAALEALRQSAGAALAQIDATLAPFDGRRLSEQPNALGAIVIEAKAAGVMALATLPSVKAIMEDQPIHPAF